MRPLIIVCVSVVLLLGGADAAARGYGWHYRGHHYHGHGHDYAPYLFGGLLLGTLLAPPRYYAPPREVIYYERQAYVPPRVVYAQPRPSRPPVSVGRRLLRDLNGDCFEREFDARGNELRTQLPASECAW